MPAEPKNGRNLLQHYSKMGGSSLDQLGGEVRGTDKKKLGNIEIKNFFCKKMLVVKYLA